jgi:predicted DNA-binding protein with PD1-like motif/glutaredoxin
MHALPLHLAAGSDVHQSLSAFAAEHRLNAFVLSVVGNLSQAAFQCPGQAGPTVVSGDLEIISLQGTLAPDGVHLHLSLSDGTCQVWGGHLEPGTHVQKGADLLIGVLHQAEATSAAFDGDGMAASQPNQPRLQIVVREGCPWCRRALRMLHSLAIPYLQVEASEPGPVPQILIDGELVGGYDALTELHASGALAALSGL